MQYSQFVLLYSYYTNMLTGTSEYFQHSILFPHSSLPTDKPEVISQQFLIYLNIYFWVPLYHFSNSSPEPS